MRRLIVGAALLAALALLTAPTASAQMGGFGAPPFGGGPGGFGVPGMPGGFGMPGGPGGFGGPGRQLQGGGPGFLGNVTQVCTDSQGNRVLVTNGGATSGYTNCEAAPPPPGNGFGGGPGLGGPLGFGGPGLGGAGFGGAPPALTRCTDSQGNVVLVRSGGSTTGYTNCTTQ